MNQHQEVVLKLGGPRKGLVVDTKSHCAVAASSVDTPRFFHNLDTNCRLNATASHKFKQEDKLFIRDEVSKLLNDNIIEPSYSPSRPHVLVVRDGRHKPRMVIDYSQTINRYSLLDAYPLSNINEQISEIAKGSVFSTLDLKSAYYQIPFVLLTVPTPPSKRTENYTSIRVCHSALLMVCHFFRELLTT